MPNSRPGLVGFVAVWCGQLVSLLGSAMTWFALTIWAYEATGQATALALIGAFSFGPTVLLSPVAGVLVDRWDRKWMMILSDLTAGLATIVVLLFYVTGSLQIWHLYVVGLLAGAFQAFQYPAYAAAVTMMVPKEQYARYDDDLVEDAIYWILATQGRNGSWGYYMPTAEETAYCVQALAVCR